MKKKPELLFIDSHTVDLGDLDLKPLKNLSNFHAENQSDKIPANFQSQAEVLITNKIEIGSRELAFFPKLKLICVAATGVNNVDLKACEGPNIAVCNVAGYSTTTVVEHTLLFLLALSHRLLEHHAAVRAGRWAKTKNFALLDFPYGDLAGKTLGILGYGEIGQRVALLAQAFQMKVLIGRLPGRRYDARQPRVALKALLQKSDYVSLHCPLTPQTQSLIDAEKLSWMKPSACLLNLARGALVVEDAVVQALEAGRLAAYATDVVAQEPMRRGHPFLRKKLSDKIILTPHVAWASRESRQRLIQEIAANIQAFVQGQRRNRLV